MTLYPHSPCCSGFLHAWSGPERLTVPGACVQGDELAPRMRDALLRGKLGISALSPRVTTGKEQWQEWHHDFFHNQMEDAIQVSAGAKQ